MKEIPAQIFLEKSDIKKLKVFGSKAWAYKLPVPANKLDTRAVPCVMVGYASNGYRVWDPVNNNVFVWRDVQFDERNFVYEGKGKSTYVPPPMIIAPDDNDNVEDDQEKPAETTENNNQNDPVEDQHSTRPKRTIKLPSKFDDYVMSKDNDQESSDAESVNIAYCLLTGIPRNYDEAIASSDEWKQAIQKEVDALVRYDTWKDAVLPIEAKAIDTRWIFTVKADGTKRARLVAKGFQEQVESNLYAPVAQMPTIRLLLSVAVQRQWEVRQLDIPSAFLNKNLESDIYIKTPKGVESKTKVLKLNKVYDQLQEVGMKCSTRQ